MTATVMQAYRFALDPTPTQSRDLERHAGAARFAFNWALATVRANLAQRVAETTYGMSGQDLTVVVEDLNVAGMLRNRRLARSISDAGFAEIRR